MSGLFRLSLWREAQKLDTLTIFAKSMRGACVKAGIRIKQHPAFKDLTIAVLSSKEHDNIGRRRFYEDGEPLSLWLDWSEAIDEF